MHTAVSEPDYFEFLTLWLGFLTLKVEHSQSRLTFSEILNLGDFTVHHHLSHLFTQLKISSLLDSLFQSLLWMIPAVLHLHYHTSLTY